MTKIHLTEQQVEDIVRENSEEFTSFHEEECGARRWTETIIVYFQDKNNKLYSLNYERGLTENQEDEYSEQDCQEVEEYEETIIVKKFRDKTE